MAKKATKKAAKPAPKAKKKAAVKKAAPAAKKKTAAKSSPARAKAKPTKQSAKPAIKKGGKAQAKKTATSRVKPTKKAPPKKPIVKAKAKVTAKVVTKKPVAIAQKAKPKAPVVKQVPATAKIASPPATKAVAAVKPIVTVKSKVGIPNMSTKSSKTELPEDNRKRYTDAELVEFKVLIEKKLEEAGKDYELLKNTLSHKDDHGTDDTSPTFKLLEDGSDVLSKEETAHLAARQEKYIQNLKNALIRIQNKTYGICRVTGKLIPKERLRSVPHATLSIDAKLGQRN